MPPSALPRLTVNGRDTDVPLWVARKRRERNKGLLGTDGFEGALWIRRCNWVHSFGMGYPIDVVYVARSGRVVAVAPLKAARLGMPRLRAAAVVEMELGAAERLGITHGSVLACIAGASPTPLLAEPDGRRRVVADAPERLPRSGRVQRQ